jgi:hypothetical protein
MEYHVVVVVVCVNTVASKDVGCDWATDREVNHIACGAACGLYNSRGRMKGATGQASAEWDSMTVGFELWLYKSCGQSGPPEHASVKWNGTASELWSGGKTRCRMGSVRGQPIAKHACVTCAVVLGQL